jgi:hypothetical protein
MQPDYEQQPTVASETRNVQSWIRHVVERTQYGGTSALEDLNTAMSFGSSILSLANTALTKSNSAVAYTADAVNLANTLTGIATEVAHTGTFRKNPAYLSLQAASGVLSTVRFGIEKGLGEETAQWGLVAIDASQIVLNHLKQRFAPNDTKLKAAVLEQQSELNSLRRTLTPRNSPVADAARFGHGAGNSSQSLPAPVPSEMGSRGKKVARSLK